MKANVFKVRWGTVALLSFLVMMVAFAVPYPALVIGLVPIFIISSTIAFLRFTSRIDKASGSLFDDYGYC